MYTRFQKKINFNCVCMCFCMWVCIYECSCLWILERELELQAAVSLLQWVLGTTLPSSGRSVRSQPLSMSLALCGDSVTCVCKQLTWLDAYYRHRSSALSSVSTSVSCSRSPLFRLVFRRHLPSRSRRSSHRLHPLLQKTFCAIFSSTTQSWFESAFKWRKPIETGSPPYMHSFLLCLNAWDSLTAFAYFSVYLGLPWFSFSFGPKCLAFVYWKISQLHHTQITSCLLVINKLKAE